MSRRSLTALLCAAQIGLFAFFSIEKELFAAIAPAAESESAICTNRTGIDVPETLRSGTSSTSPFTVAPHSHSLQPPRKAALCLSAEDEATGYYVSHVPSGDHLISAPPRAPPYV